MYKDRYTEEQLRQALSLSNRGLRDLVMTDPRFPAPIPYADGTGKRRWRKADIERWLVARAEHDDT